MDPEYWRDRSQAVPNIECTNCGAHARTVRGSYDFAECGLKNVRLLGIEMIVCDDCGNADPVIPRVSALMRLLAAALIAKPYRLAGAEIRFLRKYLRLTGDELCRLMHVNRASLSKWENGEDRIGPQSDRLIRAIALSLGEGLNVMLEQAIRKFPEIQDQPASVGIDMDTEKMSYRFVDAARSPTTPARVKDRR
jgi:DNA-binding transcriptional regulator YiaG